MNAEEHSITRLACRTRITDVIAVLKSAQEEIDSGRFGRAAAFLEKAAMLSQKARDTATALDQANYKLPLS